jgi:hypothetical protein
MQVYSFIQKRKVLPDENRWTEAGFPVIRASYDPLWDFSIGHPVLWSANLLRIISFLLMCLLYHLAVLGLKHLVGVLVSMKTPTLHVVQRDDSIAIFP